MLKTETESAKKNNSSQKIFHLDLSRNDISTQSGGSVSKDNTHAVITRDVPTHNTDTEIADNPVVFHISILFIRQFCY